MQAMRRPSPALVGTIVVTATIALVLVATLASNSATPVEMESHSPMLEPYFSWEAEEKAKLREQKEAQSLSIDTDTDADTDSLELDTPPKVVIGKSSIKAEMEDKFRLRDRLRAMRKRLHSKDLPRESTAAKLASDQAKLKTLRKHLAVLRHKSKSASALLHAKNSVADPILRKAQQLFSRQQSLQHQGEYEANQAQDQIAEGKEMIERALAERKAFLGDQAPIENAQDEAHDASARYRHYALAYANEMVAAEKVANKPKARVAMQKKLNALRLKMAQAEQQRKEASHKLTLAQMAMHNTHGVNHYANLRSQGHALIHKGEQLADDAQEYQRNAALMHARVARAQSAAAKQEAGVQEKRDVVTKLDTQEHHDESETAKIEADMVESKRRLQRLEKREASLRMKGANLIKTYHALQQDIHKREQKRSLETAKMAEQNSKKLNDLLDEEQ